MTNYASALSNHVDYQELRTLHDDKHKNYFDRLRLEMQTRRTKINSAPTVKKYEEKGDIRHEPQPSTTKFINFHTITLNSSTVPNNRRI